MFTATTWSATSRPVYPRDLVLTADIFGIYEVELEAHLVLFELRVNG